MPRTYQNLDLSQLVAILDEWLREFNQAQEVSPEYNMYTSKRYLPLVVNGYNWGINISSWGAAYCTLWKMFQWFWPKKPIADDNQMLAQRTTGSARKNMVKGVKGAGFWSAFSSNFQNFAGAATTFQKCIFDLPTQIPKKSGNLLAFDRSGREPKALASFRGWKKNHPDI